MLDELRGREEIMLIGDRNAMRADFQHVIASIRASKVIQLG